MNRALHIGTFGGIPLKIHWTFSLLVIFLAYTAYSEGVSYTHAMWFAGYVFALFLCVVLHEYGHAYAAKKFGVNTKDIILSPIGGVARLEQLPEKPKQEMIIAFAGPAVNVVIAIVVGIVSFFVLDESILKSDFDILRIKGINEFLVFLLALNTMLFVFNLVPAFPMDGGRVLRSALAMKMGRVKATKIASIVGRVLAIGFVIFGLYNDMYVLAFIGIFIFSSAAAEYQFTKINYKLEEFNVADIMRTEFTRLHIGDLFEKPIELYKRNMESNFLVFDSLGYVVGTLPEAFIRDRMKEEDGGSMKILSLLSQNFQYVTPQTSLKALYELMNKEGLSIVGVQEDNQLIGVVDRAGIKRALQG